MFQFGTSDEPENCGRDSIGRSLFACKELSVKKIRNILRHEHGKYGRETSFEVSVSDYNGVAVRTEAVAFWFQVTRMQRQRS